jgi:MFS family permease
VAVATITLVLVTGVESILGLGPAIFLTAGALAALPAGRLMDRVGRVPVIAGGFVIGMLGCVLTALGCIADSAPLVILGFAGVGAMNGAVLLARAAVADMYPESRKGRALSYFQSSRPPLFLSRPGRAEQKWLWPRRVSSLASLSLRRGWTRATGSRQCRRSISLCRSSATA